MFKIFELLIEIFNPSRRTVVVEADEPFPPLSFGWWTFDEIEEARIQKGTGHKISFIGLSKEDPELNITNSENQHWMKFEFSDGNLSYPLLVEWRHIAVSGERPVVWKVDYIRSMKLWKKDTLQTRRLLSKDFWYKMDLTVIDALASWPQRSLTGIAHNKIAVQGGYLNDNWTEDYFRVIENFNPSRANRIIYWVKKNIPDKVIRTARWRFQKAQQLISDEEWVEKITQFEQQDKAHLEHEIKKLAEVRPHFVTVDGSRLAIPLTMNVGRYLEQSEKGWDREVMTFWLFCTPQYVTNRMGSNIPNKPVNQNTLQWSRFPIFLKTSGTTLLDGTPYEEERENYHDQDYFIVRDFAQFIREAAHLWQPTELLFTAPGNYKPPEKVTLYPPDLHKSSNHFLGGTTVAYSITQFVGLPDWASDLEPEKKIEHTATKLFENTDGITNDVSSIKNEYDLVFDTSKCAICHKETGQRLIFNEYIKRSETLNQNSFDILKFTYCDEDMQYPLIIRRQQSIDNKYFNNDLQYKPPFWIIDHNASAEMWCAQQKSVEGKHPEYGRWKRVHDFAFDAVLLWPDIRETGPTPNGVSIAIGGWFKEHWISQVLRSKRCSEARHDQRLQGGSPKMCALNELPSLEWKSSMPETRERNFEQFNLDVTKFSRDLHVSDIVKDLLKNQAYYVRNDSKAILFVCSYTKYHHRGELDDVYNVPVFQYCDEDFWVQFNGINPRSHRSQKGYSPTIIRNLHVLPTSNYYCEEESKISTDLIYNDEYNNQRAGSILREKIISALEGILCDAPSHTIRCNGRPLAGKWQSFASETVTIIGQE